MKQLPFKPFGLGVFSDGKTIYLLYNSPNSKKSQLLVDVSGDGFEFTSHATSAKIVDVDGVTLDPRTCSNFRISKLGKEYILIFVYNQKVLAAKSTDLVTWTVVGTLTIKTGARSETLTELGMIVSNIKYKGHRVMYFGEGSLRVAVSRNLANWKASSGPVLVSRSGFFDAGALSLAGVFETDKGLALYYYTRNDCTKPECFAVGAALFDKKDPQKLVWRSATPILEHVEGLANKHVNPLGVVQRNDMMISYWDISDEGIVAIAHALSKTAEEKSAKTFKLVLNKLISNPILKPITSHFWESKAVFNPAALYDRGKIHLVYRAVGDNDVSVLGYATSTDGTTIDERLTEPIYVPREEFEGLHKKIKGARYASPFFSGGAYGGCEDPRLTKINGRIYMMYVAFNGCQPPRVALTSIPEDDFYARNWDQWKEPVLVSPPGVVDKNACILSEKVNGKYVIFHRIFPHILVDYVDDLDFDGKTKWLMGQYSISPRPNRWDSRKIGVGAPPIKTEYGWLLIYQSVGEQDPGKYKVGAMMLDEKAPHKVLFRSKSPILGPDQWYENEGLKGGVAYPCGAVIKDEDLLVYYGGADTVICAAKAPVKEFLHKLASDEEAQLIPIKMRPMA